MKFKFTLIALSFLMLFSLVAPNLNQVQASSSDNNGNMNIAQEISHEVIEKADKYISLENERYVISNVSDLKKEVSNEEFQTIKHKVNEINSTLKEVSNEELSKAKINGDVISFSNESENDDGMNIMSAGRTGVDVLWWGYRIYLNDNHTRTTAQALGTGAGGAAIAALWAPWFSAPTAIIKAVAKTLAIALGGAAGVITATNQGSGVYFRFTGVQPIVTYTGVHPQ
ncbi:hypothetical protein [Alteribacter populi]|uniref:hypothetical protein n=1 Tax=Alteribacter populi TaxID=2011011 RepID=UPI000BBB5F94|nr:hypothetical protein [Alteribacter populi]